MEKTHTSGRFLTLDVEQEDFASLLKPVMEEEGIGGFDVINCSMVVLHMQNPVSALSRLRTLLAPNGTVIVRDIDDGLQAIPVLLHQYEQRHLDAPDNKQWKEDFEWFRDNIVAMKESFGQEDFVFSAGFMNFTAE